jgi:DNA-binding NarL/FixJ family response regulator
MPRILVLDEQAVYRTGLRELIDSKVPCAEVIEASTLLQALSQLRSSTFDLVLVGVDLSSFGPLDSLKAAREASPATCFAIISASDTRSDILASLATGFHGFISKHQSDADILGAITDILSGRIYVPGSLAELEDRDTLDGRLGGEEVPMLTTEVDLPKLTKRQREVLSLLAGGKSNKEIARVLDIAEATTKIHMAALVRALGVRNRTEAAYRAGNLVNSTGLTCAESRRRIEDAFRPRSSPTCPEQPLPCPSREPRTRAGELGARTVSQRDNAPAIDDERPNDKLVDALRREHGEARPDICAVSTTSAVFSNRSESVRSARLQNVGR